MHIQIDWLTIHCTPQGETYRPNFRAYKITRLPYQTKQFKIIEEFHIGERRIATLCREPHSAILGSNMLLIKFDNDFLYQDHFQAVVREFIELNRFAFRSISRMDICHDFQQFHNGHRPETLIKAFLSEKVFRQGKGKFSVQGEHDKANKFQYIRFGSPSSEITVYMYNKTMEMQQVKKKPWIEHLWKQLGYDEAKDTWRLEFRIAGGSLKFVNDETGVLHTTHDFAMLSHEVLHPVFATLTHRYFTFQRPTADKNKARWPKIQNFNFSFPAFVALRLTECKESNKMDKILLRKMHSFYNEMRGNPEFLPYALIESQHRLASSRDLMHWCETQGILLAGDNFQSQEIEDIPNESPQPIEDCPF